MTYKNSLVYYKLYYKISLALFSIVGCYTANLGNWGCGAGDMDLGKERVLGKATASPGTSQQPVHLISLSEGWGPQLDYGGQVHDY